MFGCPVGQQQPWRDAADAWIFSGPDHCFERPGAQRDIGVARQQPRFRRPLGHEVDCTPEPDVLLHLEYSDLPPGLPGRLGRAVIGGVVDDPHLGPPGFHLRCQRVQAPQQELAGVP